MTEPEKQVSEVPLEPEAPRARGNSLVYVVIFLFTASCIGAGAIWWIEKNKREVEHHTTAWPNYHDDDYYEVDRGDYDAAVAHMQKLADAMNDYRQDPAGGGGVRWPNDFSELQMLGMLEPDFSLVGKLSGEAIVYQPDMPINHDPSRWVLCHDVEVGWRAAGTTGYRSRGPRAAAVILGDGTVKLLQNEELEQYGGLNLMMDSAR